MASRHKDMQSALQTARRLLPGGAFASAALDPEVDVVIRDGSGSRVWDIAGKEYLDCVNGSGPMLLGHAHPEVVTALREAVACPSNYYLLNENGIRLAEMLVDAVPCGEQVKYGVTGSDATLYAMRLARAATGRSKILKFEGGFLGTNDYALMSTVPAAAGGYPAAKPDSAGIPAALQNEVLVAPFNDLPATEEIVERHKAEIAVIVVEAQQRCIDPQPGFLEGLRSLTQRHGILLMFDEVVTGFRLAYGGAQERFGVTPDLATYGKVIGGGMPVSAVLGPAAILELANPRHQNSDPNYCFIGNTSCGNTVAAAAGIATLQVLSRPGTYERLNAIGERFRSGARAVFARHGIPGQTPGSGPLSQILLTDQPVVDYRTSISGDLALQRRLMNAMIKRGVLTHGRLYFSLAFSDEDIDRVVSVLDDSLKEVLR